MFTEGHKPVRYIYRKSPGLDSPGEKTGLPEQKKTAAELPATAIFRNCLPDTRQRALALAKLRAFGEPLPLMRCTGPA